MSWWAGSCSGFSTRTWTWPHCHKTAGKSLECEMVHCLKSWKGRSPSSVFIPVVHALSVVWFLVLTNLLHSSSSGYHSPARHALEHKKKTAINPTETEPREPWPRRNPYNFTGCLAHVEVTELENNSAVTLIVGYLVHDPLCQTSVMQQFPAIPLHPHVYEVALSQLDSGGRCVRSTYIIISPTHRTLQCCVGAIKKLGNDPEP